MAEWVELQRRAVAEDDPSLCDRDLGEHPEEQRSSCYHYAAVGLGRASLCEKVGAVGTSRDYCYFDVARRLRRSDVCQPIADTDQRLRCTNEVAPSRQTSELCAQMEREDNRNGCYKTAAIALGDASLCARLSHPYWQKECREQVRFRSDASDPCNRVTGWTEQEACYTKRAIDEADPSVCSRASHDSQEDECYRAALEPYVERAASSADWSACDSQKAGEKRADCVIALSARLRTDERCASLTTTNPLHPQFHSDHCFEAVAKAQKAPGACRKISVRSDRGKCIADTATTLAECAGAEGARDFCLIHLAGLHQDARYCALISDVYRKRDCYEFRMDRGRCSDIEAGEIRDDCHLGVAVAAGRPRSCRPIADAAKERICRTLADLEALDAAACAGLDPDYRDGCYMQLALSRRDEASCDAIRDAEGRELCVGFVYGILEQEGSCERISDPRARSHCERTKKKP